MNILAFGASYSKNSINKQLASHVGQLISVENTKILDLNEFDLPLFTVDLENEIGHLLIISSFLEKISASDLLVISMAEHNGAYTAAFKNLLDWTSRVKSNLFEGKKMILLATSDGARGGQSVLEMAYSRFPRHGAEILFAFSLPKFNENFNSETGIVNEEMKNKLVALLKENFLI